MHPLTISLPDYLFKKLTRQAQTHETSLEELVIFQLKRDETRNAASSFLQKHAGRCLTIREPIFKDDDPTVWEVPVFTNVVPPLEVGKIIVDVDSGIVISTHNDVYNMIERGYPSFGFETFAVEKQKRLAELLALNGEMPLESAAKQEMETLLAEEQTLQLRNLETLEKRVIS